MRAAGPATAAQVAEAVPVDGEPFRAELAGVDSRWQMTFRSEGKTRTLPAADLLWWGVCPEVGRRAVLVLADGESTHETVVMALDAGNGVGMESVRLATVSDEDF